MQIYLEERIGKPELFTGRKRELAELLTWIDGVKERISKSTAILSRRKTGKTALLERLYNITFENNDRVIPFYIEIRETDQWLGTFAEEFFLTFFFQYAAFTTRHPEYLGPHTVKNFETALEVCEQSDLSPFSGFVRGIQSKKQEGDADRMWDMVREAPAQFAAATGDRIVQMIDEFQFLNRFIFRDQACAHRMKNLAGSYLGTAERKHAPLLVAGSWVGWLMHDLTSQLPGRFMPYHLESIPEEEAIDMIVRYSLIDKIPVTEETLHLIATLSEGNPFYISAFFRSRGPKKDLTTAEGVLHTLEFETLHKDGDIRGTWLDYINAAFPQINEQYAKDIVLYLSKHRDRFVPRRELKKAMNIDMPDYKLDRKMDALLRCDIIEENRFQYRGVQDNIFDKVFRSRYADDIDTFVTKEAPEEYRALFKEMQKRYDRLQGTHNRYKGAFAELVICHHLRYHAFAHPDLFLSMLQNLPEDFAFVEYESVRSSASPPLFQPEYQIDVFARATSGNFSLIGEVKNRQGKFLLKEAQAFVEKAQALMRLERVEQAVLFIFSAGGFYKNTLKYLTDHRIASTDDPRWFEYHLVG